MWLNHGDSDKAANYSAQHATFDKIFVSGQQGVERYAAHGVKIPPDVRRSSADPQIEKIEVRDHAAPRGAPRTVLYAPTWRGGQPATNYSSLPIGEPIVGRPAERGRHGDLPAAPVQLRDPTRPR